MRSLLFVPGDSERKLERSLSSGADAVIVDLEDAVGETAKAAARAIARSFLGAARERGDRPRLLVRINALDTAHWTADLSAIVPAGPDGVMLPKPRSGADVAKLAGALDRLEAEHGETVGRTTILAIATERAVSLLSMPSYVGASPRLEALAWGAEDLSAEIGAQSSADEQGALTSPFRLARDLCLLTAGAAGIAAIDQVFVALADHEGLAREARAAARDGFQGKMAIHPDQVPVIHAAFTPTADEIEAARRLIAAFAARGDAGGAFAYQGRMVDAPHLARAKRVLARAGLFGNPG